MTANFQQALLFLVDALFSLYIIAMIVRCLLQFVRADFYNPISQVIWQVTNPPVSALRRIIPRWKNIDVPAIVITVLLCIINTAVDLWIVGGSAPVIAIVFHSIWKLIRLTIYIYIWSILIQAILSWVSPGTPSPISAVLWSINEPLLRPARRILPTFSGLDLSPLLVLIILQFLLILFP